MHSMAEPDMVHIFDPELNEYTWVPHPRFAKDQVWLPRRFYGSDPRIGFVACTYNKIGGTETYHQTLIPRLSNIVGFASEIIEGDTTKIGVPCRAGNEAIRMLARSVDLLIVWGVKHIAELLDAYRPKVIAVHHGDARQTWSNEIIDAQVPIADMIACVDPNVLHDQLQKGRNAVYIPNAINWDRILSTMHPHEVRSQYDIAPESKVLFWCHRHAHEKQPELSMAIAEALPAEWVTVMAGSGYMSITTDSPRIRLIGNVDSPANLLSISTAFLSTAYHEGFGLANAEAILAGVPTISTPAGIAADPQLVRQVSHDAPVADWVNAILSHFQDREFTARATSRLANLYSIQKHVDAWKSAIDEVLRRPNAT